MLKLTNICRSYGAQQVLSGLSLTVNPGQRVAIMGPSGVGKTTLLRIALGLETPEQGTVENRFGKTAALSPRTSRNSSPWPTTSTTLKGFWPERSPRRGSPAGPTISGRVFLFFGDSMAGNATPGYSKH